ncbi:LysM peptidoglycan-binding domain-containing protein [Leifsonia sp. McL0607]|uniref:LysM peptidoglycan-binding domain-containing protein n=1 Tax=Leifsonia sp. McL0607 TaxID=3415672 RepID=UPI003CEF2F76
MSTAVMSSATMNSASMNGGMGGTAAAQVRLRLTRRGRAVLMALVALPVVIGALVFALNGGVAAATGEQTHLTFHYVTVQPGDSLWSVAARLAPKADPRDVIADLVSLNGLESAVVTPGQQLAIPTQYDK